MMGIYESFLDDLLAVIHRDGGHYKHDHGTKKAVADAIALIYADRTAVETIRTDALQEAAKAAEAYPIAGSMQVADFIRSLITDGAKYCPDCEKQTMGRIGPQAYGLHRCAEHDYLFDSQLDEWPGQTHGKPRPK